MAFSRVNIDVMTNASSQLHAPGHLSTATRPTARQAGISAATFHAAGIVAKAAAEKYENEARRGGTFEDALRHLVYGSPDSKKSEQPACIEPPMVCKSGPASEATAPLTQSPPAAASIAADGKPDIIEEPVPQATNPTSAPSLELTSNNSTSTSPGDDTPRAAPLPADEGTTTEDADAAEDTQAVMGAVARLLSKAAVDGHTVRQAILAAAGSGAPLADKLLAGPIKFAIEMYAAECEESDSDDDTPTADVPSGTAEQAAPAPGGEGALVEEEQAHNAAEAAIAEETHDAEDTDDAECSEASAPSDADADATEGTIAEALEESSPAPAPQGDVCADASASGDCKDEPACSVVATHTQPEADDAWGAGPADDTPTLSKKLRKLNKRKERRSRKAQGSRTVAVFGADTDEDTPAPSGTNKQAAPAPGGEGAPIEEAQTDSAEKAAAAVEMDNAEDADDAECDEVSGPSEEDATAADTTAETPEDSSPAHAPQHTPQHDVREASDASGACEVDPVCGDVATHAPDESKNVVHVRAACPFDDAPAQPTPSKKQRQFSKRMDRRAKKTQCILTEAVFAASTRRR